MLGAIAQLGECVICIHDVKGSNPLKKINTHYKVCSNINFYALIRVIEMITLFYGGNMKNEQMVDTKQIGNLTELQCITRFYELGYSISIPYGDSEKYDFILDINGNLYKIQCKHANIHKNEYGADDYISVDECNTQKILRISQPKNNQFKCINFLVDYVDEKICMSL